VLCELEAVDEEPALLLPLAEEVADAAPDEAVAPRLRDVGVEAAEQVPAVFWAQQAALPELS
jgi:hypothetical protein